MKSKIEKICALIVDDEPLARGVISGLLRHDPQIVIAGEAANGCAAVPLIETTQPDLLFLDVQMPEMGGFETLAHLAPERLPAVIFVTAYDQYAIKAFEAQALDYLLKPFSDERFYKALARAKEHLAQRGAKEQNAKLQALVEQYQQERAPKAGQCLERLLIKSGGRIIFLRTDEIDWIEAADYYALLHVGPKSHLLRETLNDLEAKLDPEKFVRIHRSAMVNVARIKELKLQGPGDYVVILQDRTELRLSRRRREKLQALIRP